jgi:uncharacterized protein YcnI
MNLSSRPARLVRAAAAIAAGVSALLMFCPSIAQAHVTVHSTEAVQGGEDAQILFRVPNESDKAATTKIEVNLPTDTPMLGVAVSPPPGWSAKTSTTKLPKAVDTDDGPVSEVVSKIVFSGGRISGDQYLDFPIAVGKLPETDELVFKVLQTYSNGNVVRWIEQGADTPGAEEPEHPAPTLKLPRGGDDDDAAGAAAAPSASPAASSGPSVRAASDADRGDYASKDDFHVALAVGIGGAVIGLIGIGAAFARR